MVLAPGGLGDTLLLTGALKVLKDHIAPNELWVVCNERNKPLLDRIAHRCIVLPTTHTLPDRARRYLAVQSLRKTRCSVLLHPIYSTVALYHRLAAEIPAQEKIWFDGEPMSPDELPALDTRKVYTKLVKASRMEHELDKLARFFRECGVKTVESREDIKPDLGLEPDEIEAAQAEVHSRWMSLGDALTVAVCAGAGMRCKEWDAGSFARLIDLMAEGRRLVCIFVGGAADRLKVREVCALVRNATAKLDDHFVGRYDARQSAALIKACDVCVGNDTYGLHAAIAVGTPTVVIMGEGDFPRWTPWGDMSRHRMVHHPCEARGCRWKCKYGDFRCIRNVTPENVIAELEKLSLPVASKSRAK